MNGQLLHTNCAPARPARWTIDIYATMVAMGVAAAVASMIASGGDTASTRAERTTAAAFSRLSDIPSHNGTYRASLVPSDRTGGVASGVWTVKVETVTGTPVEDATVALESWMPDDDGVLATRARVTRYLGAGRYQVEGLRFDRRGWWNVRVQVAGAGATDSLAFNLVR